MITYLLSITEDEYKPILLYIYENYHKDMYYSAKSIIRDSHLAEDVVQTSYERIINNFHLVKKISCNGLRSYVVLIVRNVAITMSRIEDKYKLLTDKDLELEVGNDDLDIESIVIRNEQVGLIRACLAEMDTRSADSIILRYYYGFSDSETAKILDINSASTVRSLCYRGKKIVIKAMRKAGDIHE